MVVKAGYTPPEQYRENGKQGAFMDIYAAGAVFYEMLTAQKPMDAPDRMVKDGLKEPWEFGNQVEESLGRVVLKALALEPEQRFQSAGEFKDAITGLKKEGMSGEAEKKQPRKKRILTAALASAAVLAALALLLYRTIFLTGKKPEPDQPELAAVGEQQLTAWLAADGGGEWLEALRESIKQEYPSLTVDIETIPGEDYASRLEQAIQKKSLPDVFCTDSVDASRYCTELSRLLHTAEMPSYLYLEELSKQGEVFELPTAVQIAAVFANERKVHTGLQPLEIAKLQEQADSMGYAHEAGVFERFRDTEDETAWICGDLSTMEQVRQVTVKEVPPSPFCVYPVLEEGRLVGVFKSCYGVNKEIEKSRQEAGMVLLSALLSEGVQCAAYMDNEEGIPVNRRAFEQYIEIKQGGYLEHFREYGMDGANSSNSSNSINSINSSNSTNSANNKNSIEDAKIYGKGELSRILQSRAESGAGQ